MKAYLVLLIFSLCLLVAPAAHAIPPPDFIFNFLSQAAQFFAIAFVFVSSGLLFGYQYLKSKARSITTKTVVLVLLGFVSLLLAFAISYYRAKDKHDKEFEKWRDSQMKKAELPDAVQKGRVTTPLHVYLGRFDKARFKDD